MPVFVVMEIEDIEMNTYELYSKYFVVSAFAKTHYLDLVLVVLLYNM